MSDRLCESPYGLGRLLHWTPGLLSGGALFWTFYPCSSSGLWHASPHLLLLLAISEQVFGALLIFLASNGPRAYFNYLSKLFSQHIPFLESFFVILHFLQKLHRFLIYSLSVTSICQNHVQHSPLDIVLKSSLFISLWYPYLSGTICGQALPHKMIKINPRYLDTITKNWTEYFFTSG